ncbi:movement protein [Grapevine virus K]|uniref:movement protein n=1 Tax=Grapevine virus K TaxID=2016034 RepID=UPI000B5BD9AB|nr:movement protein [Grapevine virus K]ASJ27581.1 movement protein [Grapevine virus K]
MGDEVKALKVKKSTTNAKDLQAQIHRADVYDEGLLERLFPKRTRKCVVHRDIVVDSGEVDCVLDLMDDEGLDGVDEEEFPLFHMGCLVVAVMPHGRKLNGDLQIEVHDCRLVEGKSKVGAFKCDITKQLSAFAEFPGYFISTQDLKKGYSLQLALRATGLDFKDGTHPFSVQLLTIGRFCGEDLESRCAIGGAGKSAYQCLLNTTKEQGDNFTPLIPRQVDIREVDHTLVKSDVFETIKRLGLRTNGKLVAESKVEGDNQDAGAGGRRAGGKT